MNFAVFDTETTGLPRHPRAKARVQPRVIEFAGALVDSRGETVRELELLINPGVELEAIITKITGLTDADLAEAPTFDGVAHFLREFFGGAEAVVAHNLPFDMTMIDLDCVRTEVEPIAWPRRRICTVQEASERWGRRPKLLELYEELTGEKLDQKHRALDDVRALVRVAQLMGVFDVVSAA